MSVEEGAGGFAGSRGGLSPAARALLERRAGLSADGPRPGAIPRHRESHNGAPLSSWQQSIWFFDQMDPGRDVYNRAKRLRLNGPLDVAALKASIAELFRRHEVLRSHVVVESGSPRQCVVPEYEFTLPLIDLSALSPAAREARCAELASDEARAPFDLASGPWARAMLVREAADAHVLLFTAHHIAFDGWSTAIVISELAEWYGKLTASKTPLGDDLPLQYADFAEWQRARLRSPALDAELDYWAAELAGAPALLKLPADHSRPGARGNVAGAASVVIPASVAERLRVLGREESATLFMTLLAAFQLLLSRLSGQDDVVAGIPVAGRSDIATEKMIGCFINVLPIRTRIAEDCTFRELLRNVRGTVLDGFAHQEVPFEAIVERIQPERSLAHTPLTQVLFNFRNMPAETPSFAGLEVELESATPGSLVSDLDIEIEQRGDGLHCSALYSTELFDASTIERWLGHFRTLLDGIVAAPDERVSRIPLLTAAERRRIVADWNVGATAPDYETCVHRLIEAQVRRTPDAMALIGENGTLTYAELNRRANALASDLVARGVGPDVLVGVHMERCFDLVVALLAVLKAGGAYVPLDPDYPVERLAFMLSDSQPAVLLAQRELAAQLDAGPTPVIHVDAEYWGRTRPDVDGDVKSDVTPGNLAYVIYTSGSTGRPKGAMITHRAVCNLLLRNRDCVGFSASDVTLLRTPVSFDLSVKELFLPLIAGGCVALARPSDSAEPEYLVRAIETYGVTILFVVPTLFQLLLDVPGVGRTCESVRAVMSGAETLSNALLQKYFALFGVPIYNTYGPTETTVDALSWSCERGDRHRSVPIGRPLANYQVYILDSSGEPVPVGVTGEIFLGGVGVGRGYLKRPELTAERFVPDRFGAVSGATLYRTGDLGRFDDDGVVEILGRADHQVKLRGVRIELGEIESVISGIDGVRECAVILRDDAGDGPALVAYVVADTGVELSERALRETLRARLLPAMVPSAFLMIDALPLTPSRKIDRKSLPALAAREGRSDDARSDAATPTEVLIASVWTDVLRQSRIDLDDDFFELGGHSLHATRVMSRVREQTGVEAPLKLLFEQPTVRSLARAVDDLALSAHSEDYLRLLLAEIENDASSRDRDPR